MSKKKRLMISFGIMAGAIVTSSISVAITLHYQNNCLNAEHINYDIKINKTIKADDLDLKSKKIEEAAKEISNNLIYKFKDKIFLNKIFIKSKDSILNLKTTINNNELNVDFILKEKEWKDANGKIGRINKVFSFSVSGF